MDNNTVGWYQSTVLGAYQTVELIDTFVNYHETIKKCVCLVYDPQRSARGQLGLKALRLRDSFIEHFKQNQLTGECDVRVGGWGGPARCINSSKATVAGRMKPELGRIRAGRMARQNKGRIDLLIFSVLFAGFSLVNSEQNPLQTLYLTFAPLTFGTCLSLMGGHRRT